MGGPHFFVVEHRGPCHKEGWGSSSIKVRNLHLPYFGIMFEGGS